MTKHLVWGPGCIHAPHLQVHASTRRAICPGTGEKRHRFKSVPELGVHHSEQLLQCMSKIQIIYDGDNYLKAICNSKSVLVFSYWLIFCQHFVTMTSDRVPVLLVMH